MSTLITYKIASDRDGKLKAAAKVACDFWNKYVISKKSIVIRLGTFYSIKGTIARAYKPHEQGDVIYGTVEFNTRFMGTYSKEEISATIIHEIGHILGFGWDLWMELFDRENGRFLQKYIDIVPGLEDMYVETDYGTGTSLSHWDERRFDAELMTGLKNREEYVLPVTIDVMELLGHQVAERLENSTSLFGLIRLLEEVQFLRQEDARKIDRDYFIETELVEEIYADRRAGFN